MHGRLLEVLVLAIAFLVAACDGGTEPRVPTALEKVQGDEQTEPVNTALPVHPVVRVRDQNGEPLPGVRVGFTVTEGSGSVAEQEAYTDAEGLASSGAWTLGTAAGANGLGVTVQGVPPATFRATGAAGAPANVTVTAGSGQQARVAEAVATPPAVRVTDVFGNPTPGVQIDFRIGAGAGQVESAVQHTDAQGLATVGVWRLGSVAGENRLDVTAAGGASTSVTALGVAGPPSAMLPILGEGGVAQVAAPVTQPPVVRVADAFGNPVSGVTVSFAVAPGGSVEPVTVATGSDGLAAVVRWTLGTTAGPQTLSASADGLPPLTFSATGTAGAPSAVAAFAGQNQTAPLGSSVPVRPAAVVTDGYGNRVGGATVTFVVTSGGGSVDGAVQQTDGNGVATVSRWTLGPTAGLNALEARLSGGPAARFEATAVGASGGGSGDNGTFDLDLRFGAGLTAGQQAVFLQAAARWEELITGDVPSVPITLDANDCGNSPAMNESVDDLVIFASAPSIDGVSGVLGRAGPCLVRSEGFLPVVGFMELDADDVAALEAQGELLPVVLHEIGHVLGIGTVWELKGLLAGKGTTWPWFPGERAVQAFDAAGGTGFIGAKVPLENTGGSGTRESHWRESVLGAELMTGYLNGGARNPLSAVTVASLLDLGYSVDATRADPYSLSSGPLGVPGLERPSIELIEQPVPPPIPVGPDGTMMGRPSPQSTRLTPRE